ncbi:hypothetical protein NLJ89_g9877 [Agrocybe chaxingu]|uniref:Uncharacterized protein n=1 Tax=Agrocybe chaxingu TaxID=84603 RepID=A0A9W8JZR4_9AGAR|nr:hypothetical protein NLJ89_g9877 [Agrocybe chaxingu]
MFDATLRYINLFILPNPKFSIPTSEMDPVYRMHPRTTDLDASYISQNTVNTVQALGPMSFSTPTKPAPAVTGANRAGVSFSLSPTPNRERAPTHRRNTVCAPYQDDGFDPFTSGHSGFSVSPLGRPFELPIGKENIPLTPPNANRVSSIKIVTPTDSPSPSMNRRLIQDIAALYSPKENTTKRFSTKKLTKTSKKKGKTKRKSAPPILALHDDPETRQTDGSPFLKKPQTSMLSPAKPPHIPIPPPVSTSPSAAIYALPQSHLISPTPSPPVLVRRNQNARPRPHSTSGSSFTSKLFELDLSPIVEDTQVFGDAPQVQIDVSIDTDEDSDPASALNSSGSSYGELLHDMTIDYFSLSQYGTPGRLEWGNDERSRWAVMSAHHPNQSTGDTAGPEDEDTNDWQGFNGHEEHRRSQGESDYEDALPDDSSLFIDMDIPELTLTVPTPELESSPELVDRRSPPPDPTSFLLPPQQAAPRPDHEPSPSVPSALAGAGRADYQRQDDHGGARITKMAMMVLEDIKPIRSPNELDPSLNDFRTPPSALPASSSRRTSAVDASLFGKTKANVLDDTYMNCKRTSYSDDMPGCATVTAQGEWTTDRTGTGLGETHSRRWSLLRGRSEARKSISACDSGEKKPMTGGRIWGRVSQLLGNLKMASRGRRSSRAGDTTQTVLTDAGTELDAESDRRAVHAGSCAGNTADVSTRDNNGTTPSRRENADIRDAGTTAIGLLGPPNRKRLSRSFGRSPNAVSNLGPSEPCSLSAIAPCDYESREPASVRPGDTSTGMNFVGFGVQSGDRRSTFETSGDGGGKAPEPRRRSFGFDMGSFGWKRRSTFGG